MTLRDKLLSSRCTGILLPLAAMKTNADWGVGDFGSLKQWTQFFAELGVSFVQILPLQETAPGENCPYSALTSFAVDPVYVQIDEVPDIEHSSRAQEYIGSLSADMIHWRAAAHAPFAAVKAMLVILRI